MYSFFSFLFISFLRVNRNIACKKKIYTIWTYDTDKIVNVTRTSNKFKTVKNNRNIPAWLVQLQRALYLRGQPSYKSETFVLKFKANNPGNVLIAAKS